MTKKISIPRASSTPFSLASRYAADTADVVIYDPADLGAKIDTGLRVRIKSLYSNEAREAVQKATAALTLADGKVEYTQIDWAVNLFEQTVAITVAWWDENGAPDGICEAADAPPTPCTEPNVRRIYDDPRTGWMQKQVQAAYLDLGRFFPTRNAS